MYSLKTKGWCKMVDYEFKAPCSETIKSYTTKEVTGLENHSSGYIHMDKSIAGRPGINL